MARHLLRSLRDPSEALLQDPHWPFNGTLMVLNSGDLGYNRGQLGSLGCRDLSKKPWPYNPKIVGLI